MIISGNSFTLDTMLKEMALEKEVLSEVEQRVAGDKLAEIEAMFYLGRDRLFPEYYERRIETARKVQAAAGDPRARIVYLIDKTNFLRSLQEACRKLGRLSLADRLSKV
jgi:hypothetical protein